MGPTGVWDTGVWRRGESVQRPPSTLCVSKQQGDQPQERSPEHGGERSEAGSCRPL